jgi:hypothetical protein
MQYPFSSRTCRPGDLLLKVGGEGAVGDGSDAEDRGLLAVEGERLELARVSGLPYPAEKVGDGDDDHAAATLRTVTPAGMRRTPLQERQGFPFL